jgi:hypothetical protein
MSRWIVTNIKTAGNCPLRSRLRRSVSSRKHQLCLQSILSRMIGTRVIVDLWRLRTTATYHHPIRRTTLPSTLGIFLPLTTTLRTISIRPLGSSRNLSRAAFPLFGSPPLQAHLLREPKHSPRTPRIPGGTSIQGSRQQANPEACLRRSNQEPHCRHELPNLSAKLRPNLPEKS